MLNPPIHAPGPTFTFSHLLSTCQNTKTNTTVFFSLIFDFADLCSSPSKNHQRSFKKRKHYLLNVAPDDLLRCGGGGQAGHWVGESTNS